MNSPHWVLYKLFMALFWDIELDVEMDSTKFSVTLCSTRCYVCVCALPSYKFVCMPYYGVFAFGSGLGNLALGQFDRASKEAIKILFV